MKTALKCEIILNLKKMIDRAIKDIKDHNLW